MDPDQNIELLAGYETDGWTLIKYRRQLASCEPINDLPITVRKTNNIRIKPNVYIVQYMFHCPTFKAYLK